MNNGVWDTSEMRRVDVKVGRKPVNIAITGQKDPRGSDNNVYVWIDDDSLLHIRVFKADRCYRFQEVVETQSHIEVIAK